MVVGWGKWFGGVSSGGGGGGVSDGGVVGM